MDWNNNSKVRRHVLKLSGRILKGPKTIRTAEIEKEQNNSSYRDTLEECLIKLCKKLDIQVPLWLKKNTSEFALYKKTFFSKEQFMEDVEFDRFEITFRQ